MHVADLGANTIYLDHAATTPVDPEVVEAMLPYFSQKYGNPSSIYRLGQESRAALDQARGGVARVLGCVPEEILFTSGATESDNLALRGIAWAARFKNDRVGEAPHIVTTSIEHHAVLHTARSLQRQGFDVTYVPPDSRGIVAASEIAAAIRPETCLISVMYANNETGAIQPVREIAAVVQAHHIPFHTDAVQAAGLLPLDVDDLGVDLLSLSAHKFYGPKGVGVLYVRRGTEIDYQQVGGSQEQGRRGGTENVAGIVGLSVALERANERRAVYGEECARLRDQLLAGITASIPDVEVNGPIDPALRLANNLNVSIAGIDGEMALLSLDLHGIAASTGSACTTGNTEPSHVLRAMGLNDAACRGALRFTVGKSNTSREIDETVRVLTEVVQRARMLAGATIQ